MRPDYSEVFTQRWYAVVNDLIGGWLVSNVDKPAHALDYSAGEWDIADFMDERTARHIADLHNASLQEGNRIAELEVVVAEAQTVVGLLRLALPESALQRSANFPPYRRLSDALTAAGYR